MNYALTITTAPLSATLRVAGELDYETADDLVDVATQLLEHDDLCDLHIDFTETTFLDSAALSGLLLLRRRTSQAGMDLHLDHRPHFIDRVLQVTGLFNHFVPPSEAAAVGGSNLLSQSSIGESRVR